MRQGFQREQNMKTPGKYIYPALFCAVVVAPYMAHSVTLGSTARTPCLFGALGSRTQCANVGEEQVKRNMPVAVTPRSSAATDPATKSAPATTSAVSDPLTSVVTTEISSDTPPSEKIVETETETEVVEVENADENELKPVPLPLGGALLLGSIGLMLLANRKRS